MLGIAIADHGNDKGEQRKPPETAWPCAALWRCVMPDCRSRLTIQADKLDGPLFSIFISFHLEGETFAQARALPIFRKHGNVNEYFRSIASRGNEPKSAIIVPFCEHAIHAYRRGGSAGGTSACGEGGLSWNVIFCHCELIKAGHGFPARIRDPQIAGPVSCCRIDFLDLWLLLCRAMNATTRRNPVNVDLDNLASRENFFNSRLAAASAPGSPNSGTTTAPLQT